MDSKTNQQGTSLHIICKQYIEIWRNIMIMGAGAVVSLCELNSVAD